jgi:heme/copper-type cytochrome/quinol oxidase subunit 2
MKRIMFMLCVLLLLASCGSSDVAVKETGEEVAVAEMPAEGAEDVKEMVVVDDAEAEDEEEEMEEETLEPITVELEVFQFGFDPETVEVMAGQEVTLIVSSQDTGHSLTIASLGIHIEAQPGSPGEQTFTVDEPGEYTWDCKVYCGSGHSDMHGTLVVK